MFYDNKPLWWLPFDQYYIRTKHIGIFLDDMGDAIGKCGGVIQSAFRERFRVVGVLANIDQFQPDNLVPQFSWGAPLRGVPIINNVQKKQTEMRDADIDTENFAQRFT